MAAKFLKTFNITIEPRIAFAHQWPVGPRLILQSEEAKLSAVAREGIGDAPRRRVWMMALAGNPVYANTAPFSRSSLSAVPHVAGVMRLRSDVWQPRAFGVRYSDMHIKERGGHERLILRAYSKNHHAPSYVEHERIIS